MTPGGRIRVLHMGLDDSRGGIESFLYNMSCNIDWKKFQFDFLCYGDNPAYGEELAAMGAHLDRMPGRRNPIAYVRKLDAVLSRGYDILHLHKNSPLDFTPVLVGKRAGCRVIVHAHNTHANVAGNHAFMAAVGRSVVNRHADARLACSKVAAEWLFGKGVEFTFVPNGIDLGAYAFNQKTRDEMRQAISLGNRLIIGCIGRFVPQKNQAFLVDVLRELRHQGVDAIVVFLGDGPERAKVARAFAEANLAERAIFFGAVDGVQRYLQALDAVVMPSLYEGLPLVAVEAQAAGLPLIVSDTVTEEIDRTPLVHRLSLSDDSPEVWARAVVAAIHKDERKTDLKALEPFDALSAARSMQRIYCALGGESD